MNRHNNIMNICLLFFLAGLSMNAFSQTLKIDRFFGKHLGDENYVFRINIEFYPDGLIRSYEERSSTDKDNIKRAFNVFREGNIVKQVDPSYENIIVSLRTFTINSNDTLIINSLEMQNTDTWKIQHVQSSAIDTERYMSVFNNDPGLTFIFSPKENRIENVSNKNSYTYGIPLMKGLPNIKTKLQGGENYSIKKTAEGKILLTHTVKNGLDIMLIRIEGELKHTDPIIAIINYELISDYLLSPALFPYIGGSPSQISMVK